MKTTRKPGRPYTGGADPPRILGRVGDRDWARMKAGAKRAGLGFSEWARQTLLAQAKLEKK